MCAKRANSGDGVSALSVVKAWWRKRHPRCLCEWVYLDSMGMGGDPAPGWYMETYNPACPKHDALVTM